MSTKISPESELDLSKIGSRIKSLRESRQESQIDFSKKTGISKGNLSGMENHKNDPSYAALVRIIETYNVNPTWLLTGKGPRDPSTESAHEPTPPYAQTNPIGPGPSDPINRFNQKALALKLNNLMLKLEDADPAELEELKTYLEFRLSKKPGTKPGGKNTGNNNYGNV